MASAVQQAATAAQGIITAQLSPMKEGAKVPATLLKENDMQNATVNLAEQKGKIVIVGVPGAFSPACSTQAPGFVEQAQKFEEKGVTGVYIVAINDVFVTQAWKEKLNAKDSQLVHFLADDTGAWSAAAGMSFDATALLGNRRSNRYAALAEDGIIKKIFIEEAPTDVKVSTAENLLQHI